DLEQVEVGVEPTAAGGAVEGGGVVAEGLEVGERAGVRLALEQGEVHLEQPGRGGDEVRQGQRQQAAHLPQDLLDLQQPVPPGVGQAPTGGVGPARGRQVVDRVDQGDRLGLVL